MFRLLGLLLVLSIGLPAVESVHTNFHLSGKIVCNNAMADDTNHRWVDWIEVWERDLASKNYYLNQTLVKFERDPKDPRTVHYEIEATADGDSWQNVFQSYELFYKVHHNCRPYLEWIDDQIWASRTVSTKEEEVYIKDKIFAAPRYHALFEPWKTAARIQ